MWNSSAPQSSDLHLGATQGQGKELSQHNGEGRWKDKAQPAASATRPVRGQLRGLKLARLPLAASPAPSVPALLFLGVLCPDVPSPATSTKLLCSAPYKGSCLAPGSQLALKAIQYHLPTIVPELRKLDNSQSHQPTSQTMSDTVLKSSPKGSFFLWTFQSEPSPCISRRTQFPEVGQVESIGCISNLPHSPPLPASASPSLAYPVQPPTAEVVSHRALPILIPPKDFS